MKLRRSEQDQSRRGCVLIGAAILVVLSLLLIVALGGFGQLDIGKNSHIPTRAVRR